MSNRKLIEKLTAEAVEVGAIKVPTGHHVIVEPSQPTAGRAGYRITIVRDAGGGHMNGFPSPVTRLDGKAMIAALRAAIQTAYHGSLL